MKVESREATPYDKLSTEDKDGIKGTVATTKLTEFLKAEEDKLAITVTLPAEPTDTAPSSPNASPAASPSVSPSPTASAK